MRTIYRHLRTKYAPIFTTWFLACPDFHHLTDKDGQDETVI